MFSWRRTQVITEAVQLKQPRSVLFLNVFSTLKHTVLHRKNNHLVHHRRHLDMHLLKSSGCISIAIMFLIYKPFTPSIFCMEMGSRLLAHLTHLICIRRKGDGTVYIRANYPNGSLPSLRPNTLKMI